MEVFTLATLVALGYQVTTLLKYLSAGQFREFVTGLVPMAAMFVVLLVGSQADVTEAIPILGDRTLGSLNWASLLLAGMALGSSASVVWDVKKAVDGSDSAAVPPLGGGPDLPPA